MSTASDDEFRASVRARLEAGGLPRIGGSVWAGDATGTHRCGCCMELIRDRVEYQLVDEAKTYTHLRCFAVWREECRALDARLPRAPGD